jgi:hypothetical protein
MLSWQVLITSIPHRHDKLLALLDALDKQAQPGFGVLLYRDNLQQPVAVKRQVLLEAATANYVSFVDDDDEVPGWFVFTIMSALSLQPDYVGFPVACYVDGGFEKTAEHSLRYTQWQTWPERYVRDITHLNPLRRELALLGRFDEKDGIADDGRGEDGRWADSVRASGLVREEEWISQVMYRYYFDTGDCHLTKRKPMRGPLPNIPDYPWLEIVKSPLEGK